MRSDYNEKNVPTYKTYNPATTGTYDLEREQVVPKESENGYVRWFPKYQGVYDTTKEKVIPKGQVGVESVDLENVLMSCAICNIQDGCLPNCGGYASKKRLEQALKEAGE